MKRSAYTPPARWVWRSPPFGMRRRKARSSVWLSRAASKAAPAATVSKSRATQATRRPMITARKRMTATRTRRRKARPARFRIDRYPLGVERARWSVSVVVGLVRSAHRHADIGRLPVRHFRELDADLGEMQPRHFLVEVLGQRVDLLLVLAGIGPQLDLRQHLVGERGGHHKARMAHGIAEVHQPPLGKQDDALAVRKLDLVDLRLDVVPLEVPQRGDLDLAVEMPDIGDDGAVLHL